MIYFIIGLLVGLAVSFTAFLVLLTLSTKYNKRKLALKEKATGLWQKAGELFETARIWYVIGNKQDAVEALDEAARIAMEAQKFEDEADGKKTS